MPADRATASLPQREGLESLGHRTAPVSGVFGFEGHAAKSSAQIGAGSGDSLEIVTVFQAYTGAKQVTGSRLGNEGVAQSVSGELERPVLDELENALARLVLPGERKKKVAAMSLDEQSCGGGGDCPRDSPAAANLMTELRRTLELAGMRKEQ